MLETYLATIKSPMNRAKAKSALTTAVRLNGSAEVYQRRAIVEMRIGQGSKVMDRNGEIVLMTPDGAWLDARHITKHGLNYAAWLSVQPAID